mmetsp:Transcript_44541/g.107914  ORF Transcript_44541/g.107914 Transcript_44541/m.107914 type:complete len:284 (+) Transcript_44541:295-1146(+)
MLSSISDSCCGSADDINSPNGTNNPATGDHSETVIGNRNTTTKNTMAEQTLNKPPPKSSSGDGQQDEETTAKNSTTTTTSVKQQQQQQFPPTPAMSVSSSSSPTYSNSSSAVQSAIDRLKELSINFVALDFDQTILDLHTGGRWTGTVDGLFPHVRPVFVSLMRACQSHDIQVAIVTFSQQTSVVRGVLDSILKDGSTRVPIRGGDRSWSYRGKGSQQGKQPHMASAVEELEHRFNVEITKQTTLLIDDDAKNIRHALNNGTRAVWFNPNKPHRLLPEMIKLV